MDSDSIAFWGIQLTPKKPLTLELQGGETLNVTMASLCAEVADKKGRSVVMVHTGEIEQKFAVCVLNAGSTESFSLDLHFEGEEKITFTLIGKNEVHLTGNFSFDEEEDDDEGDDLMETLQGDLMELEDAEEDADSDDNDILDETPIVEEVEEDDDEESSSEEEEEEVKPKFTPKPSQKKKAEDNGIASGKKSNKKPKKVVEKAPPKVEKTEPKVEPKETKVKTPKRKASEANVQTPSKKSKAANGNSAPTTPPTKTPEAKVAATPQEGGTGKKNKNRKRKRQSKAGNTPAK